MKIGCVFACQTKDRKSKDGSLATRNPANKTKNLDECGAKKGVVSNNTLSGAEPPPIKPQAIREMRQAHTEITDEEFEQASDKWKIYAKMDLIHISKLRSEYEQAQQKTKS